MVQLQRTLLFITCKDASRYIVLRTRSMTKLLIKNSHPDSGTRAQKQYSRGTTLVPAQWANTSAAWAVIWVLDHNPRALGNDRQLRLS
jgi:hypothetical protein